MATKTSSIIIFLLITIFCSSLISHITLADQDSRQPPYRGKWRLLKRSIGVSAMHMALLPNDRVIVFDRTDFGPSNITLPQTKCRRQSPSPSSAADCYAHSVEFDPSKRTVRPLTILTDTWCSSGALSSDGVLVQTGGFEAGERAVRRFEPCADCDWVEDSDGLVSSRWYASDQVLPDGRVIVVGGRLQFSYEFIPKSSDRKLYRLQFLRETRYLDKVPNNLYPFLHLSPEGYLFVFANDRGILLDYVNDIVVREFAAMPGGVSRNYPSTGSSVLLPINLNGTTTSFGIPDAVVLVCGGTVADANVKAMAGEYIPATRSCGRLKITAASPEWEMEEMPMGRVMGDMILLPTGDVLIVNGAGRGTAGWDVAREPVLNPVLYRPGSRSGSRFEVLSPTKIPRLYHSTAHLLSDGRVLVGGSNPNRNYNFSALFPTELSLEAFYPPYLMSSSSSNSTSSSTVLIKSRPWITIIKPGVELSHKQKISVHFRSKNVDVHNLEVYVTMVAPSFTTHSFAMNQRLLVLDMGKLVRKIKMSSTSEYVVEGCAPATAALAPPGYYLLFVVVDGVPSRGKWVRVKQ